MIKKVFPATVEAYSEASVFIESTLESLDVSFKGVTAFNLSSEELFVNVAHYAYDHGGEIEVQIEDLGDKVSITFIDSGKPFDPTAKENPNVSLSLEERDIGGLGIFLVKKLMDEVTYERIDNKNILRIIRQK